MTANRFGLLLILLCSQMGAVVPQATSREELDAFGLAYDASDPLEKIKACESFLGRYPKSAFVEKAWELEFEAFSLRGDSGAALRVGLRIIAMDPHQAETLSRMSVLAVSSHDPAERSRATGYALRAVEEVVAMRRPEEMPRARYIGWKHETLARAHATLGEVALRTGNLASAVREFQEAIDLIKQPEYLKLLGLADLQLKQYAEASRTLQEATELSPDLPGGNLLLGMARFYARDYNGSAISLVSAVASEPPARDAYLYLMRDYVALDTLDLEVAERAVASFPHDAELLFEIGQATLDHIRDLIRQANDHGLQSREVEELKARKRGTLSAEGPIPPLVAEYDRTAALLDRCFEGVLRESADSSYGRRVRGYVAESQNHFEEALADYRAGGDHFAAGRLLAQNARYEEAIIEFRAELNAHQDNHLALAELSQVYVQLGKMDFAKPILDQLLALYPGDAYAWLDKGRIEQKSGHWREAATSFKTALAINPNLSQARYRLATVYRHSGDSAAADAELDAFRAGQNKSY